MTFIFRNWTIFWYIPKQNRRQTNQDRASIIFSQNHMRNNLFYFILFYLCEKQLKHSIMQQLMQCPTKGGKISNTQSRMLQKKKVYIHFFSRHETCLSILTIMSCNLQLVNTYIQCDQITTLLLVSFYFVYKITKDYNFTRKFIEIFFTHQQLRNLNYKCLHWKLSVNQLSYNILNKNY